jgi:hypothetical protein
METDVTERCHECENLRQADVCGDGRILAWCAVTSDDNLRHPDCLYFYRRPTDEDDQESG